MVCEDQGLQRLRIQSVQITQVWSEREPGRRTAPDAAAQTPTPSPEARASNPLPGCGARVLK
jgi:hypothetical protein